MIRTASPVDLLIPAVVAISLPKLRERLITLMRGLFEARLVSFLRVSSVLPSLTYMTSYWLGRCFSNSGMRRVL